MWGGLALGYAIPALPPSTAIVAIAVVIYYSLAVACSHRATTDAGSSTPRPRWPRPGTSAAARGARCSSCSTRQPCALTAVEIEDALRAVALGAG